MVAKCQCMVAGSPCYCRSVSASALYKAAFPLSPLFFWQQGWACPAWLQGLGPDWNEKRIKTWQTHRSAKKAGTGWSGCWDGESSASWKLSQFSSRVGEAGDSVRLDGKMGSLKSQGGGVYSPQLDQREQHLLRNMRAGNIQRTGKLWRTFSSRTINTCFLEGDFVSLWTSGSFTWLCSGQQHTFGRTWLTWGFLCLLQVWTHGFL